MLLYFARHGKTFSALDGRLKSDDEPLLDEGRTEVEGAAETLREELGHVTPTHIISSPRRRTQETAAIFKEILRFAKEVEIDDRLAERNCDAFEGQPIKDVFAHSEKELVAGGMEPEVAVYERTKALWDELVGNAADDDVILLVGHSTALKPLAYIQKELSPGSEVGIPKITPDRVWQLVS